MSAFIMFLTGLDNRHFRIAYSSLIAVSGVIFVSYVREIPT